MLAGSGYLELLSLCLDYSIAWIRAHVYIPWLNQNILNTLIYQQVLEIKGQSYTLYTMQTLQPINENQYWIPKHASKYFQIDNSRFPIK